MMPFHAWVPAQTTGTSAEVRPQEEFQVLELRVVSAQARSATVDRGSADGLAAGDRVVFRPRDGRHYEGTVVRVGERDASVELDDPSIVPAPGTKGEARIPSSRLAAPEISPEPELPPPTELTHPAWERTDDEWRPGDPLLAHVRPLRPEEREPELSGRVYSILDGTASTEGNRSDVFARTGTSLLLDNYLGGGGQLRFDAEVNYRNTDVPDNDDEQKTRLRLDRLSYAWGGNRFDADRYEIGRFLQYEMPEFGVLDGFQWSRRTMSGSSFGTSAGFLPQPDAEMETGDDLQLAAYYRWVADESEQFSVAGGFQKTFHHLDRDRDLFIAKVLYLPVGGWYATGTAWIDAYTAGDDAKGPGVELTQAYASTGKRWEGGSTLRFTYSHQAFPENALDEFTPVTAQQLADDHSERLATYARGSLGKHAGVFGQVGGWIDEDDEGGDAELGVDASDVVFEGSLLEAGGFYTQGRFSSTLGWRASLASTGSPTTWRLGYEFSYDDVDGFAADNDSLPNHRIGLGLDHHPASQWSFSVHFDVLLFDEESSLVAGFFLQRSF